MGKTNTKYSLWNKYGKILFNLTDSLLLKTYITDFITQLKRTTTCTNAQSIINQAVITVGLTEDNLHLFTKCSRIQKIWTHYQTILTKLIGKTYTPLINSFCFYFCFGNIIVMFFNIVYNIMIIKWTY